MQALAGYDVTASDSNLTEVGKKLVVGDLTIRTTLTRYEEAKKAGQDNEQSGKVFAQIVSSDISGDQNGSLETGVGAERIVRRTVLGSGVADREIRIVNSFANFEQVPV